MKSSLFTVLFVVFSCQVLFAYTGREIMEKSDALAEADTGRSHVIMKIKKGTRVRDKEFIMYMKKFPGDEDRALIEFSRPTKIRFLTHSHKRRDDDQWITLSSGRVKRIAASEKDKPFVNSHFFYEDMQSRDIDDYNYKLKGEGKGAGEDCYIVESVKKKKSNRVYDKTVLYVRKSDFFVVRIDFYRKGRFIKYLENYRIKKINGILTPLKVVMMQADDRGGTMLSVSGVKYNMGISSSRFNKDFLR